MQCMKCGRDVESGEVFCELCREDMEKYPVRPGTVVVIPQRPERHAPKRQAKRQQNLEEQLAKCRKMNRILAALLAIYVVAAGGLVYVVMTLYGKYEGKHLLGQNYSVIQEDDEPTDPFVEETGPGAK